MKIYTYSDITAMLKEIVEEFGSDYVYPKRHLSTGPGCVYAWEGKPDCIVGHVLTRIDAIDPVVCSPVDPGNGNYPTVPSWEVAELNLEMQINALWEQLAVLGFRFDPDAQGLLETIQDEQDSGVTWGAALDVAMRWVSLRIENRL